MRTLAIDFGLRRIGLAISDPEGRLALPLGTLERKNDRGALRALAALALKEGVGAFVIGEPRNVDGTLGPAAERVAQFGDRLAALTGLPVRRVQETLTTVAAAERLREAGGDPRRDAARLDALAAQILLEEALAAPVEPR